MRNEDSMLDTSLHPVASANIHVLVYAHAIEGNAQSARDLIRVLWHLDRCPDVKDLSPGIPFREYAEGFDRNRGVSAPGHTKLQVSRGLGEVPIDIAPDERAVEKYVRAMVRVYRWGFRIKGALRTNDVRQRFIFYLDELH